MPSAIIFVEGGDDARFLSDYLSFLNPTLYAHVVCEVGDSSEPTTGENTPPIRIQILGGMGGIKRVDRLAEQYELALVIGDANGAPVKNRKFFADAMENGTRHRACFCCQTILAQASWKRF